MTVDELLAQARDMLPHRPTPAEALRAQGRGVLLVDIRGDDQRRDGLIPGALVIPRNCLEWRCDPASQWRHPAFTRRDLRVILVCRPARQLPAHAAARPRAPGPVRHEIFCPERSRALASVIGPPA
ncbi:MAG TPA: rhodanese-like domain-containing protein [Streptosporangiaceae bacterium]|nr:rhodanese-like domain-containing protein [Streptosporangiaceae bacterium]